MNVSREAVSVALFSLFTPLLAPGGPFVTVSRRYPTKATMEDAQTQPALYLVEDDENDNEEQIYSQQRYLLRFKVVVLSQTPDDGMTSAGTILNPLLDAVDNAMKLTPAGTPLNGMKQTLSNVGSPPLVANAWINGRVFKNAGVLSAQNYGIFNVSVVTGQ